MGPRVKVKMVDLLRVRGKHKASPTFGKILETKDAFQC